MACADEGGGRHSGGNKSVLTGDTYLSSILCIYILIDTERNTVKT